MNEISVGDFMTPLPSTVGREQTLAFARERMHQLDCRHLPVLHGGHLVGIVSERDVAIVESLGNVDVNEVLVEEAMSEAPYAVAAKTPLVEVARSMAKHKYGAAVVMDGDTLRGIFTTTDAMGALHRVLSQA